MAALSVEPRSLAPDNLCVNCHTLPPLANSISSMKKGGEKRFSRNPQFVSHWPEMNHRATCTWRGIRGHIGVLLVKKKSEDY